jgi:ferric-dicitrate binding protein FerR (iron transport regulator)
MARPRPKEFPLWDAAIEEHTEAVDEFCDALKNVATQLGNGRQPSPAQLAEEESARLRLQNARALLVFGVGIRPRSTRTSVAAPRSKFRLGRYLRPIGK